MQVKDVIGGDAPSQPITPITWNGELPFAEQAMIKVHYTSHILYVPLHEPNIIRPLYEPYIIC